MENNKKAVEWVGGPEDGKVIIVPSNWTHLRYIIQKEPPTAVEATDFFEDRVAEIYRVSQNKYVVYYDNT